MSYSLYDATVLMAKGALTSLDRILSVAEKLPDSATFLAARLSEDMNPLTFQVYYATFLAEAVASILSGREYQQPDDDLDSYEKMHTRIAEVLKELEKTDKDTVDKIGETMTHTTNHEGQVEVPVKALVGVKHMPNVYFHVAMAYAILRKEGAPLGKRDWSRAFASAYV
ncbi:uncharacterized protein PRCAT00003162001 [Priceomyces carsonii]|uniref:uncharacterized protein n=1 Tax=Priceomyces carsonii TaxID=28549 RepID=UPI002ED7DD4A|nr:unnamed protein product [Priceomyces carsonii]